MVPAHLFKEELDALYERQDYVAVCHSTPAFLTCPPREPPGLTVVVKAAVVMD